MNGNKLPKGWDDDKPVRVLAHYEAQSEEEAALEDEDEAKSYETIMTVPNDLVPVVRELIAKRQR